MSIKTRIARLESTLLPCKPITYVIPKDGESKEKALSREGINADDYSMIFFINFEE